MHLPQGIWYKQGYPKLFVIEADTFTTYYYLDDVALIFSEQCSLHLFTRELKAVSQLGESNYEIQFWDSAGPYTFEKLLQLPNLPVFGETQGWNQDINLNFEALWSLLKKHFAFAQERSLDWATLYTFERAKALACQTPEELFAVLADLVKRLQDGHSGLSGVGQEIHHDHPREKQLLEAWFRTRKDTSITTPDNQYFEKEMYTHVMNTILSGKGKASVNNKIVWGVLANGVGYLGFQACCDFASENASTVEELAALEQALALAFNDFKDTAALIIDARFNTGGLDVASLHLAGRFTTTPRLAFRKYEVVYGEPQNPHDVLVSPVATPYSKPVVFLTSTYTCSAAEIATMAFRVLPTVTVMGQTTHGSLSDSMSFVLPNGWKGWLSNEVYLAADGNLYEGLGLPPKMTTPDPSEGAFWERLDETLKLAQQHVLARVNNIAK